MDIEKLKYDLALAYAKSKLDYALAQNTLKYVSGVPESVIESDYLLKQFNNAYANYSMQTITIE